MPELAITERVALSVDTSDIHQANDAAVIAREMGFNLVSIGSSLLVASGGLGCAKLADRHSLEWVANLNLYDNPNNTAEVVRHLSGLDTRPPLAVTLNIMAGGKSMEAARSAVTGNIKLLGAVVLDSVDNDEARQLFGLSAIVQNRRLTRVAAEAGLHGVVTGFSEVGMIKSDTATADLSVMAADSLPETADPCDHPSPDTVAMALQEGADWVVVGGRPGYIQSLPYTFLQEVRTALIQEL